MLAVSTSMIGAAVFGIVALLASVHNKKRNQTASQRLFQDLLKMAAAGGLAVGMVLIAISVTKIAHFGSDSAELALMLGVPVMTIMVFRLLQAWLRVQVVDHRLHSRINAI